MIEKLVRKNVLDFQPYLPGKPIEEVKRELGLTRVDKLASNENPLGPSPRAVSAMKKFLNRVNLYPDGSGFYLKKVLATRLKVKLENIILGSGTDEIIEIIGKTFLNPTDEIVVSKHAFIRYEMAGELMGCQIKRVPMKNFTHDLEAMKKAINETTKIVFIANPNNPTGTYVTEEEVAKFMNGLPEEIMVVFDEAYREYVTRKDYPQTLPYVKRGQTVIVLRTFSKIYGLAGLRIGYGIGKSELIGFMERIRPPFNTNSLAQIAAQASLSDESHIKRSRELVDKERKYLEENLEKMGVEFVPSVANHILLKVGNGKDVFDKLLKKGIIVRAMAEYDLPEFVRVTIGLPQQNRRFINALREVMDKCS
ncbi:histidinol-phosphate transaminase [bacterium]|nr:histidinol-phosphate transaminase [bacterium]NIN93071.1 histidinol-phosphate transaminase [bacterium]NIO18940.1 histidinol-phosphate transaminase [bacterium]NIO74021.1 histidinol-phosphate transaminase [bacterium]